MPCYRNADHKNVHVFEDGQNLCHCNVATTVRGMLSSDSAMLIEFTKASMQGLTSEIAHINSALGSVETGVNVAQVIARVAVTIAKATIAELEKEISK